MSARNVTEAGRNSRSLTVRSPPLTARSVIISRTFPASVTNDSPRSFPPFPAPCDAPWIYEAGANASQRTVTSPCRQRGAPSVTGQSAVRSRTARIQRCRAPYEA